MHASRKKCKMLVTPSFIFSSKWYKYCCTWLLSHDSQLLKPKYGFWQRYTFVDIVNRKHIQQACHNYRYRSRLHKERWENVQAIVHYSRNETLLMILSTLWLCNIIHLLICHLFFLEGVLRTLTDCLINHCLLLCCFRAGGKRLLVSTEQIKPAVLKN